MNRRVFLGALGATMGWGRRPPTAAAPPRIATGNRGVDGEVYVERWSWAMGQAVHLQLYAASEDAALEAAQRVFAELRRVEARLSLFEDTSDLCEVNRCAGRGPVRVGPDCAEVLATAEQLRRTTGGVFDVAVEPLMRIWGFHAPRSHEPSATEIAEAEEAVRTACVVVDGDRIILPTAHTQLDLGGIGVGYGLDRAVLVLRACGIRRALVDVSGDYYALGAPPGERGWRVEVADVGRAGRVAEHVCLRDAALATSSNLVSVVHYGRRTHGHVMDPRTGVPAVGRRWGAAVATTGVAADVLGKVVLVTATAGGALRAMWR